MDILASTFFYWAESKNPTHAKEVEKIGFFTELTR